MKYKTIFIGNESPYLDSIKECSDLALIVCKPIRGNAKKYFGSSFQYAKKNRIPFSTLLDYIQNPQATDLILVSGCTVKIPLNVIRTARVAAINIHQSLLPAYRGRHPINWAIIRGEKNTGVTLHYLTEQFDEGRIIFQNKVKTNYNDTVMDVHRKTVLKGNKLLRCMFRALKTNGFKSCEQNIKKVTYLPPRTPTDGKINWADTAKNIRNLVRALVYPYPGAYFYYKGLKLIIEKAEVQKFGPKGLSIGQLIFDRKAYMVRTGSGFLIIKKLRNREFTEVRI